MVEVKYMSITIFIAMTIIVLFNFLSFNKNNLHKTAFTSFECGIDTKGQGYNLFSLKFIYIAILFIVFDLEIIVLILLPLKNSIFAMLMIILILTMLLIGLKTEYKNMFLTVFLWGAMTNICIIT